MADLVDLWLQWMVHSAASCPLLILLQIRTYYRFMRFIKWMLVSLSTWNGQRIEATSKFSSCFLYLSGALYIADQYGERPAI